MRYRKEIQVARMLSGFISVYICTRTLSARQSKASSGCKIQSALVPTSLSEFGVEQWTLVDARKHYRSSRYVWYIYFPDAIELQGKNAAREIFSLITS